MKIEYDLELRVKLHCSYKEEDDAYEWLSQNGFRIDQINHTEEYVYLTGKKKFLEEKKK